jgi:hypothetical protein
MAADENYWMERAQSAEAKQATYAGQVDRLKEKVRIVLATFGAREKSDGSFDIDYGAFVEKLGREGALEVRRIIDEQYGISGAPGEKPKVRVKAA